MAAGTYRNENREITGGWICGETGEADHLATIVRALRIAVRTTEGAEVHHFPVVPEERGGVGKPRVGVYGHAGGGASNDNAFR